MLKHAFVLFLLSSAAHAQSLSIPLGQQGDALVNSPSRGQSPSQVLEQFGLPQAQHPAVGSPPITRWDYPHFSVYFEHQHVINSVLKHQPSHPTSQTNHD
ncbi:phosphodiesterase [Atopomonas sediminilitoris]|uniref:phosphodiesterase n=1 Tax=Atopomonas sediminilitoris TaxID=2919919 RepID=UPI001F4D705A|nr:phosphodiesterase [Atopomonas sediminilitoris]MCJ8167709.1 phosphodiesterase [Atopomonas sediminilitoris]